MKKIFLAGCTLLLVTLSAIAQTNGLVVPELVYRFPQQTGWASELVQGRDGNLYGTTYAATDAVFGTIFKLAPDGEVTTVAAFDYETTGGSPSAGMIVGHDGNLYGTTCYGSNGATVFKYVPGRGQEGLSALCSLGTPPTELLYNMIFTLLEGKDHNFYGTVMTDSEYHLGFAYRVTPQGNLTIFTNFNYANGGCPLTGLTRGPGKALFGTTMTAGSLNGVNGIGTVFRMDLDGNITPINVFDGSTNGAGAGGLCLGRNEDLYGTTRIGGPDNSGTIFRITRKGELKTLVLFRDSLGKNPMTPLVRGIDGNFYGTTYYGGTNNTGIAFRMTPQGKMTELFSFGLEIGVNPSTALIQANDGYFYGTTPYTGSAPPGIYRFQGMEPRFFRAWQIAHSSGRTR